MTPPAMAPARDEDVPDVEMPAAGTAVDEGVLADVVDTYVLHSVALATTILNVPVLEPSNVWVPSVVCDKNRSEKPEPLGNDGAPETQDGVKNTSKLVTSIPVAIIPSDGSRPGMASKSGDPL